MRRHTSSSTASNCDASTMAIIRPPQDLSYHELLAVVGTSLRCWQHRTCKKASSSGLVSSSQDQHKAGGQRASLHKAELATARTLG